MDIVSNFVYAIGGFLPKVPWVILGVVVGWVIIRLITFLLRRTMKLARVPKDIVGLVITVTKFILWILLVLIVASSLGLSSLAIYLSGSAAVVAFFLSASVGPTLSNIFSGIFLTGDPDIKVGMKISTNNGQTVGVIHGIDMRKVRITGDDGKLHIVPNSMVENGEWIVLDRNTKKK